MGQHNTLAFFLVDKSDVFATFKSFVKGIHNEFETTIKKVRSDNDSEFKNTRIDELCDEFGIRHQLILGQVYSSIKYAS